MCFQSSGSASLIDDAERNWVRSERVRRGLVGSKCNRAAQSQVLRMIDPACRLVRRMMEHVLNHMRDRYGLTVDQHIRFMSGLQMLYSTAKLAQPSGVM